MTPHAHPGTLMTRLGPLTCRTEAERSRLSGPSPLAQPSRPPKLSRCYALLQNLKSNNKLLSANDMFLPPRSLLLLFLRPQTFPYLMNAPVSFKVKGKGHPSDLSKLRQG